MKQASSAPGLCTTRLTPGGSPSWRPAVRAIRSGGATPIGLLALSVAAATALFAVVDAMLLKGLPFPEDDRLAVLHVVGVPSGRGAHFSAYDSADLQAWQGPFESIASIVESTLTLPGDGLLESVPAAVVSPSFFPTLRIDAARGRTFSPDDERGCETGVVASHAFWTERLASADDVVGTETGTGTSRRRIVGVLPASFTYPYAASRPQLWFCAGHPPAGTPRPDHLVSSLPHLVARLQPGVQPESAQRMVAVHARTLHRMDRRIFADQEVRVVSMRDALLGDAAARVTTLGAGSALLLVLCCLNVAGMMTVRVSRLEPECRIRFALGATRTRLIAHFARQAALEASLAGAAGLVVAVWFIRLMNSSVPPTLPVYRSFELDARALGLALAAVLLASLAAGVAAVVRVPDASIVSASRTPRRRAIGSVLVGAQVALAVLLLVATGLFALSYGRVATVDRGFVPEGLLAIRAFAAGDSPASGTAYHADLMTRLSGLPGVQSVALASACAIPLVLPECPVEVVVPATGARFTGADRLSDRPVSGPYFHVMGMRTQAGTTNRPASDEPVAVLNEMAASMLFGRADDAVGRTMVVRDRPVRVIGVVSDVLAAGPEGPVTPAVYRDVDAGERGLDRIVIRGTGNQTGPLERAVRRVIADVLPAQPVPGVLSMAERFDGLIAERRFATIVVTVMGLLGVTAAASGLWSLIQAVVSRRQVEIAIRRALGARARHVAGGVLRAELGCALGGVAVGLGAALAVGHLIEVHLSQIGAARWIAYAGVPVLVAVVSIAAIAAILQGVLRHGFDAIRNRPAPFA